MLKPGVVFKKPSTKKKTDKTLSIGWLLDVHLFPKDCRRKLQKEETFGRICNLQPFFEFVVSFKNRCLVEIGLPKVVKLRTLEKLSLKVSGPNHHQKSMPSKKASATSFAWPHSMRRRLSCQFLASFLDMPFWHVIPYKSPKLHVNKPRPQMVTGSKWQLLS